MKEQRRAAKAAKREAKAARLARADVLTRKVGPGPWPCSWWEKTEKPIVWAGNIGSPVYRNMETGEEVASPQLPIGALYVIDPKHEYNYQRGFEDGEAVMCVLPDGHHWSIDGRCSNCDKPDDLLHRCWVRHGKVGGRLHVDKVGVTCNAGAGSILTDNWHGYLHNHQLRT